MKKLLSMIMTAGISLAAFAGTKFNEVDQAAIDRFWTYRMEVTCMETDEETVRALDSYKKVHAEEIAQLSEEASILLDALILMERYNYLYVFPGEDKASRPPFEKMRKRITKYLDKKKESDVTPYILLCNADITSYYMSYSIKDIIFNGMSVKKYQEKAIAQEKTFSPAMLNLSSWYYYSPRIFGGSREETRKWLLKSLENARIDAEVFFAKLAYSQFLFEMKEYEESTRQLDDAEKLCPGSRRVKLLKEQNALGLSLNDYNKQRSKILKSADDYKKKKNIEE